MVACFWAPRRTDQRVRPRSSDLILTRKFVRDLAQGAPLAAVAAAMADIRQAAEHGQEAGCARTRIAEMSAREVLEGLLAGQTNKEIGRDIGISPRMGETHPAHVMQRLGAKSVPE